MKFGLSLLWPIVVRLDFYKNSITLTLMNLQAIAGALTRITGNDWAVTKDRNQNEHLTREDGLELWLRIGGYGNEGKAAIHFSRPVGRDGRSPTLWPKTGGGTIGNPSINVSLSKPANTVAKDIVRRMLAEAEVVFKLANESIAQTNNHLDGREKAILAIASVAGGEPERHYQSKELTGEVDPYKCAGAVSFREKGYGKISVSSADSISLELTSMNFETAEKVVAAVRNILNSKE